jgi:hypothetical protein
MLYREFNKINCMFKLDFNPLGLDCVVFHEIYVLVCYWAKYINKDLRQMRHRIWLESRVVIINVCM